MEILTSAGWPAAHSNGYQGAATATAREYRDRHPGSQEEQRDASNGREKGLS
jgi:hypothetical protein